MKALDVFGSVIKYYKDHILQCFKDRPYYLNDIHWVITVPPSWGFKAKQLMKDAADQAGIYNDQLTLALEPEAACSYCPVSAESTTDVGKAIAEMQIGEQVIVCNSGGATTDLTVYEVTGPKMLKKIDQAYGGHYGGNTVNAELFKILTILFSGPVIKRDSR
ncbi:unnamed protein product [Mytilus edulis]|uniref:Uncharacterized protein n=1 Tax=Mytilus edulis TaxID=6550 RepID=A0A8S3UDL2_MYTED|nr:unnamed protein product [Mytilus edulis]